MASRRISRTKSFSAYLSSINDDVSVLKSRADTTGRGIEDGSISGTSLTDEVSLVSNGISSSNYIPNYSGWRISGSGVAEFSNVFVRGDINAYSGTIGYWNISSPSVSRTFGDITLYGTFLESSDVGDSDANKTDGTYVGLFKSYTLEPNLILSKYRKDNIATITTPGHAFLVGDRVYVSVTGDTSFSSVAAPVSIIATTGDTISYINEGLDFTNLDASGDPVDNTAAGAVTLYNPDVAGLYLRDYSKREFDYGYFSNTGVSYVSAEDVNLIENPSFEFRDSSDVLTPSTDSWSTTLGSGLSLSAINIYTANYSNSIYGGVLSWTTVSTGYLSGKIDYTAGNAYKLFEIERPLYFNLTVFPNYDTTASMRTVSSMVSYSVSTDWFLEVTTSTNHGLVAGDSVFFDFNATYSGNTYLPRTLPNGSSGYTYVVAASPAPTPTKFYIDVAGTFPAPGVSVTRTPRGGGVSNNELYKVYEAALDLSAIRLRYPNGQTTNLYNVLSPLTKSEWDAGTNKYLISYANDYIIQSFDPDVKVSPIAKTSSLIVDGASIAAAYQAADPTSFATGEDVYIDLPGWMLKHDGNVTVSATKLATIGYIVDNVHLSTAPNFFYGSELATNRWYATTEDVPSYVPTQASIEGTKTWLNIDLTTQAATLDYFNQIGFRNNTFTKPMTARPSAGTQDDTPIYQTFTDSEYETTTLSGGQYQLYGTSSYKNINSTLKLLTGDRSSGFELSSGFRYLDAGDGSLLFRKAAVIAATYKGYGDGVSNADVTTIRIGSDRLIWTEDTDNLSSSAAERIIIDRNEAPFGDGNPTLTSKIAVIVNNTVTSNSTITSTSTGTGFHANGGDIQSTNGDIYTTAGNIYTNSGNVTANTVRLTSTADYNLASINHPFQAGPTNSNNLRIDDNGIQAVNNGAVATLNINTFGGNITIGNTSVTSVLTSNGAANVVGILTTSDVIRGGSNIYTNGIITTTSWNTNSTDFSAMTNGLISSSNTGGAALRLSRKGGTATSNADIVEFYRGASAAGALQANSVTGVSFNNPSDYRLKENVVPISNAIQRLLRLKPSKFNFITYPDHEVEGFIAHEIGSVVPLAANGKKDELDESGNPKYQGADYTKLIPLLTAALQEAIARIEILEGN